jgi:hypothetical protein
MTKHAQVPFVLLEQKADQLGEVYTVQSDNAETTSQVSVFYGKNVDMIRVDYKSQNNPCALRFHYGRNKSDNKAQLSSIYAENKDTGKKYGWPLSPLNTKIDDVILNNNPEVVQTIAEFFDSKMMTEFLNTMKTPESQMIEFNHSDMDAVTRDLNKQIKPKRLRIK